MKGKSSIYFEFIGAEGAGKTTLAKEVSAILELKGYNSICKKSLFRGKNVFLRILWFFYLLKFLRIEMFKIFTLKSSKILRNPKKLKKIYVYLSMRYHIQSTKDGCLVLNDQSILIDLISLFCKNSIDKEKIIEITKSLIPEKTFFIFIKTSPQKVLERHKIRGRESKITRKIKREERLSQIEKFNKMVQSALEEISRQDKARFITVNGDNDIKENTNVTISEILKRHRMESKKVY